MGSRKSVKPRSVVIGGMKWKIFWNKDIITSEKAKGLTIYFKQEIWIERTLDEVSKRHVFLHELLHAIWYSYTFTPRLTKRHHEEDVVSQIPPALLQVFDDNPKVANYVIGGEK